MADNDPCDVCCNPEMLARSLDSYRPAVLRTLCEILAAIEAGEAATNVNVLSVIPGTGVTNLGKAQGEVSTPADVGVEALFYREAVPSATGVAAVDGEYSRGKVDTFGALYVQPSTRAATFAAASPSGAAGAISTTGVLVLANVAHVKILTGFNKLDVDVVLSADGGTTYPYPVPSGAPFSIDVGANGLFLGGAIWAKAIGSNSSSGNLYVGLTI